MIGSLFVGPYCVVLWWQGRSLLFERWAWAILPGPWPTVYAGAVKFITGPGLPGQTWALRFERAR